MRLRSSRLLLDDEGNIVTGPIVHTGSSNAPVRSNRVFNVETNGRSGTFTMIVEAPQGIMTACNLGSENYPCIVPARTHTQTIHVAPGVERFTVQSGDLMGLYTIGWDFNDLTVEVRHNDAEASATFRGISIEGSSTTVTMPPLTAAERRVRLEVVPTCADPGQNPAVTSIPTAALFYRRANAPAGTLLTNAGTPTWETDDPDAPTSLKRGYLDLDGFTTGETYVFSMTYEGERYDVQQAVPATGSRVEDEREVISFEVDAEEICS